MDGTRQIACLPNRDRIVEIDEMQQRMRLVIGEPGLVDLDCLGMRAGRHPRFRVAEEICDRQALQTRHLDHVGKERCSICSLHLAFGHASPRIHSIRDPCRVFFDMNSCRSLP